MAQQQHDPTHRLPLTNLRDPNQVQPSFDLLSSLFVPPCAPTAPAATPSSGTPLPRVRRRLRKLPCNSDDDTNAPSDGIRHAAVGRFSPQPVPSSPRHDVIVLDEAWPVQQAAPFSHTAAPLTQAAEIVDLTACPSPCAAPSTHNNNNNNNQRATRTQPFAPISSRPQQVSILHTP